MHECCGIDAYNFSPLHIASHLSGPSGEITENDIGQIEKEIAKLIADTAGLEPNKDGYICSIEGLNQYFSKEDIDIFVSKLKTNLLLSPKVLEYSNKLEAKFG